MGTGLKFDGVEFISARDAAKLTGYTSDYVGQLCRGGKIEARMVGRAWYVKKDDVMKHSSLNVSPITPKISNAGQFVEKTKSKDNQSAEDFQSKSVQPSASSIRDAHISQRENLPISTGVSTGGFVYQPDVASLIPELKKGTALPVDRKIVPVLKKPKSVGSEFFSKIAVMTMSVVLVFGGFYLSQSPAFQESVKKAFSLISEVSFEVVATAVHAPEKLSTFSSKVSTYARTGSSVTSLELAHVYEKTGAALLDLSENSREVFESFYTHPFDSVAQVGAGLVNSTGKFFAFFDTNTSSLFASVAKTSSEKNIGATVAVKVYTGINNLFCSVGNLFGNVCGGASAAPNSTLAVTPITKPPSLATAPIAKPTPSPATPSPKPSTSATFVAPVTRTVVEKTTERVIVGDITSAEVDDKLNKLNNALSSKIYEISASTGANSTYINNVYNNAVAPMNRIDSLSRVTISSPTISGGTISNSSISGGTISDVSISGTSGAFSSGLSVGGQLTVSGTATSTFAGDVAFDSNTLYIDSINHRVGISTTSPIAELNAYGNLLLSGSSRYFNFGDAVGSSGYGLRDNSGVIEFKNVAGAWTGIGSGSGSGSSDLVYSPNFYRLSTTTAQFLIGASSTTTVNALEVIGSGYFSGGLGIGTTSPSSSLAVVGTTTISGVINYIDTTTNTLRLRLNGYDAFVQDGSNVGLSIGRGTSGGNPEQDSQIAIGVNSLATTSSSGSGYTSIAIGYSAGQSAYLGYSIAIGEEALRSSKSSSEDVAIGRKTLTGVYTASTENVAVGNNSLYGSLGSSILGNVAVGQNVLGQNTDGDYNTALGYYALEYGRGDYNTAIGYKAGKSYLASNNNIFLGRQAGGTVSATYTGSDNIFIGKEVAPQSSSQSNYLTIGNLIFGTNVDGTGTTVSTGNIGIGSSSPNQKLSVSGSIDISTNSDYMQGGLSILYSSSTMLYVGNSVASRATGNSGLVAIGKNAHYSATGVSDTVAIGDSALYSSTGGYSNVAIGSYALYTSLSGGDNVAIGRDAARAIGNSSYSNIAIGRDALYGSGASFDVTNNTAIGYRSMNNITTGSFNTGVGDEALGAVSSGTYNAGFGKDALVAVNSGTYNAGIGVGSGSGITTGIGNTGLGTYSMSNGSVTGHYNVAIGYDSRLPSNSAGNQLSIGNLIYGTGLSSNGSVSGGNVGISSTSPAAKLSLNQGTTTTSLGFYLAGFANSSADLFRISTSTLTSTSTAFVIDSNGKVGIGTTTPYAQLSVAGLTASGYYNADSRTATSSFMGGLTLNTNGVVFNQGTPANTLVTTAGGNVGIGDTLPGAKLSVSGSVNIIASTSVAQSITQYGTGDFLGLKNHLPGATTLAFKSSLNELSSILVPKSSLEIRQKSSVALTANTNWNSPDVGLYSAPAFADLDNDGDYDLLIGEDEGSLTAYENTGTALSPTWTAKSAWDVADVGSYSSPAFADLDNDGDYDLLIGENAGIALGYENTGTASSPTWVAKTSWNTADVGSYSAPDFADLDNDGDYDLLIGEFAGVAFGYENTGTVSSPTWTAKTAWNTVDVGFYSAPAFADLDNDGDYDLLIGDIFGVAFGYENTGTASSPTWTAKTSWNTADVGGTAAPAFADLDNDGDYDLLIGEDAGISKGYEHTGSTSSTFFAQNGNVGIGTTTPSARLTINQNSTTTLGFYLAGFGNSIADLFRISTSTSSGTSTALYIDSSGRLAIGTTTISGGAALTVQGLAQFGHFLATSSSATSTIAGGLDVGNGNFVYDSSSGITSISSGQFGNLNFDQDAGIVSWVDLPVSSTTLANQVESYTANINNNPVLTIFSQADGVSNVKNIAVGIGTTSPNHMLDILAGSTTPFTTGQTKNYFGINAVNQATSSTASITKAGINITSTGAWSGTTASNIGLLVSSVTGGTNNYDAIFNGGGNVGIGTTSPLARLSVSATSSASNIPLFVVATSTASATSTAFIIDSNGKVGIGTTTPTFALSVEGQVILHGLTSNSSIQTITLCQTPGGEVIADTATCAVSSGRFKHDIQTLSVSGLSQVMALRPVTFVYNDTGNPAFDSRGTQLGFIAEEAQIVDPNLVELGSDGLPRTFRYETFTAVLTKAIQELNLKVDSLSGQGLLTPSQTSIESLWSTVLSKLSDVGVSISQGLTRITSLFAGTLHVEDKLCADDVCIDKNQLKALLIQAGGISATTTPPVPTPVPPSDTVPPTITLNGVNPAHVEKGTPYIDLGATVDDDVDHNLGLHFFVDGISVSDVQIDTGTTTTHTIEYVATDNAGNTATSSRSVIVDDIAPPVTP